MTSKIWEWFQDSFSKIIGKAITRLTHADGEPGLSWKDIQITAEFIRQAESQLGTGAERRAWVLEQIKRIQKIVVPHIVELMFWTALNVANQKGWVQLGNTKS